METLNMPKPRLKMVLFEKGITGRELARRSGLSESIISLAANGRYNLDPVQKAKIVSILKVPAETLFGHEEG